MVELRLLARRKVAMSLGVPPEQLSYTAVAKALGLGPRALTKQLGVKTTRVLLVYLNLELPPEPKRRDAPALARAMTALMEEHPKESGAVQAARLGVSTATLARAKAQLRRQCPQKSR